MKRGQLVGSDVAISVLALLGVWMLLRAEEGEVFAPALGIRRDHR